MKQKLGLIFLAALIALPGLSQTKLLDSLNRRLKSQAHDTIRFDLLESYVKATRIDSPDSAITKCNEAIELARKLHDQTRVGRGLTVLGTVYYYKVDYPQAEKIQRE